MPDQDHASLPDWLPELEALCGYALERSLTVGEATQRRDEFSRKCGPRTVVELVDLIKAQREEIAGLEAAVDAAEKNQAIWCEIAEERLAALQPAKSQLAALRQGPVRGEVKAAVERVMAFAAHIEQSPGSRVFGRGKTLPVEDLRALLAAIPTGGEGEAWRPIESAPRDGTRVDLVIDGQRSPDAYWGRPDHSCGEAGQYCDSCPTYDGWVDSTFMHYLTGEEGLSGRDPTHWRPPPALPPAPSQDGGGRG